MKGVTPQNKLSLGNTPKGESFREPNKEKQNLKNLEGVTPQAKTEKRESQTSLENKLNQTNSRQVIHRKEKAFGNPTKKIKLEKLERCNASSENRERESHKTSRE